VEASTELREVRSSGIDTLDARLLGELEVDPRLATLELARRLGVTRATAQARLDRLARRGLLGRPGSRVDLRAAGYDVLAFVTLEIAQGQLEEVRTQLAAIPEVLEAHGVTGGGDVLCRVVAATPAALQEVLVRIDACPAVVRGATVVALSELVAYRVLPALEKVAEPASRRLGSSEARREVVPARPVGRPGGTPGIPDASGTRG
jgi:DNA-binding Lrp family transcriptional regulator